MKVLISGASGLVATELIKQLAENGDEPIRLVRRPAVRPDEIEWHPERLELDPKALDGVDAIVNLAGATTGKIPWTKAYKNEIVQSRINSTRTLVQAMNASAHKPKVFVSGSASGIYGDRGDEVLNENSSKGVGFLAELAFAWEQEALKAPAGVRVVLARTTMVMSRRLGALGRLLPLIKLGVGGPLGSGKQWWAWITEVDEAAAIRHLISTETAVGPFNLTAPQPATCAEIVKSLANELGRPAVIPVPAFAMRLLIGEAAEELLLCSQKMTATKLLDSGYVFTHPTLQSASKYVVGK